MEQAGEVPVGAADTGGDATDAEVSNGSDKKIQPEDQPF